MFETFYLLRYTKVRFSCVLPVLVVKVVVSSLRIISLRSDAINAVIFINKKPGRSCRGASAGQILGKFVVKRYGARGRRSVVSRNQKGHS